MTYTNNEIKDSIKRVSNFIKTNKRNPNTVKVGKNTLKLADYLKLSQIVDGKNRINKWIKEHDNTLPNYVNIKGFNLAKTEYQKLFGIKTPTKKTTIKHNTVSKYFEDKFGKYTTIDGALSLVNGKGYGYYYNDKMSNKQTIDNIAKKGASKPNCTDSCHIFWHIGKALGYEVRAVHIKCKGGDGHIRLQFKHPVHTGGKWINRDPACVLSANGKPITCCWCLDGTVLAYDPQWFKANLNR